MSSLQNLQKITKIHKTNHPHYIFDFHFFPSISNIKIPFNK